MIRTLFLISLAFAEPITVHEYTDLMQINIPETVMKVQQKVPQVGGQELLNLFKFQDFVGKTLDGKEVNFHLPHEKNFKPFKFLILSYFAEWCGNCNYEAPLLRDLYQKYSSRGLQIVGRSEYSELKKVKQFMAKHKIPYPVIVGSIEKSEQARLNTFLLVLRKALGDQRNWGTPFNIIIVNGDIENPFVASGEMRIDQLEKLIQKTLG